MSPSFKLGRVNQCKGCPWKVTCDPEKDIPFYDQEMHESLRNTIAEPGQLPAPGPVVSMMCHEHPDDAPERCVGWLVNQLALGNVALRLRMVACTNLKAVRLDGPQHPTFDDTLPK